MIKKLLRKCIIILGLLLLFTVAFPNSSIAQAGSIEKEKDTDYRLNLRSITLVRGDSFSLKVYNLNESSKVSFKSADTEIASINEDGSITAKMVGFTTVTATIKNGLDSTSLTCDVTVGPPAFSVKFTRSRVILGLDKSDFLGVILKPSNTAEEARFSSYNSEVASISTGGRVTGNKSGMTYLFAQINATDNDGTPKYAVCSVIVTKTDDVQLLETYFTDHPELSMVPDSDLQSALYEFFNQTSDKASSIISDSKTITEALNRFLNERVNLADYKKAWDEAISKAQAAKN